MNKKLINNSFNTNTAILFFLAITLCGCAGFRRNMVPRINEFPPITTTEKKPEVSFSFKAQTKFATKSKLKKRNLAYAESEFLGVLKESGYFSGVSWDFSGGDINIDMELLVSANPLALIPAIATGYSLWTVPSWVQEKYFLTAKVRRSDGTTRNYEVKDAMVQVQWLPMIFVAPFKIPYNVGFEVRKNMYRKLIVDIGKDLIQGIK